MMDNVVYLGPHKNMTPEECLSECSRMASDYQDVIIVGYDEEGAVFLRSSHISRSDALWLLMEAIDQVRDKV